MDRAYAVFCVKGVSDEARTIHGIAATPTPDRTGDIFETVGARFAATVPLLLHHDRSKPIGVAELATEAGAITFKASLPVIPEPGALRDRVDEAWQSIKAGLIRGVSIGFRPLADGLKFSKKLGGFRITKSEILELSLVTIPANVDATIQFVKAYDAPYLAAFGLSTPGVAGQPARLHTTMAKQTAAEQISAWENKRAANVARMSELMTKAADAGLTLDAEQTKEYDELELEVKTIDEHLVRARALEKFNANTATPVPATPGAPQPFPVVSVKDNAPKGQAFVRSVMARVQANGDSFRAMEIAKQWHDPNVELLIKAAVGPAMTTDNAWAGYLVQINNLIGEFIELSRPATLLGKIQGMTKVPFNTAVPIQTGGGTYKWVGQAKAKPVGKLTFGQASIGMAKAAGIIVLTEELARSSNPSAEEIVRRDMVAGIAQFLDQQFTDPAVAEVAQTSPASITNGAGTAASSDNPNTDIGTLVAFFAGQNIPLGGLTILMSELNAYAMGVHRNPMGVTEFPGVGIQGGTANGVRIIASNTVGDKVIGLAPEYILYADDGGVKIDVSREATLQMNDAPVTPADPATTVWTNMFQDNLVALRAERFINWKRAADNAVYYLTGASYPV